jgi:hypothetical protein
MAQTATRCPLINSVHFPCGTSLLVYLSIMLHQQLSLIRFAFSQDSFTTPSLRIRAQEEQPGESTCS